jgi:serine phosphatase RsbU (regulator of sigma subunit)
MKQLRNWLIGDYLAKTHNVFERAKINLTFNFAVFFLLQALVMYINLITHHLWYHLYFVSFGWVAMFFMLYILKTRQSIKLAAIIWLLQFIIIGTGTMLIQGGGMDMMSGFWIMLELLFAYFTLGGKWAMIALIHVSSQIFVSILNDVEFHGTLLDLGVSKDQRFDQAPVFTLIPFMLCIYIITKFVSTRGKAEKLVDDQNVLLEEKNKEITDSINYAQHIQKAILPSQEFISNHLSDSFIIYMPKSIVSGDFYWMQEKNEQLFFAVGDCTGHGVPGAMLSVIAQNILNRIVFSFPLLTPSQILDKASEFMEAALTQGGGQMRDGMDIALCSLNKKTMELEYAGANNPLYIISNNELKEFKANKEPIGKFETKAPFSNNKIQLQKGDAIYLFSDGFADQFGGPNGKKFKYKTLKELLLSVHQKSNEEQKNSIITVFEKWKGNMEQVDDVCLLGVKI